MIPEHSQYHAEENFHSRGLKCCIYNDFSSIKVSVQPAEMQLEHAYQMEILRINGQPTIWWYLMSTTNLPMMLCTCQNTTNRTHLSPLALSKERKSPTQKPISMRQVTQKKKKRKKRNMILLLFTLCHSQTTFL